MSERDRGKESLKGTKTSLSESAKVLQTLQGGRNNFVEGVVGGLVEEFVDLLGESPFKIRAFCGLRGFANIELLHGAIEFFHDLGNDLLNGCGLGKIRAKKDPVQAIVGKCRPAFPIKLQAKKAE